VDERRLPSDEQIDRLDPELRLCATLSSASSTTAKEEMRKELIRVVREVCAGGSLVQPHIEALLEGG